MRAVSVSLDRRTVELDLSEANYARLRDLLTPYLEAGRKPSTPRGSSSGTSATAAASTADGPSNQVVREWAEANGHQTSPRGRLKKEVIDAYRAAHA